MRLIIAIGLLQCVFVAINAEVDEQTFSQLLDHNAPKKTYWDQRYFVNNQYWPGTNTTVFLTIGGEGAADIRAMTNGIWMDWAAKHEALMFLLEHRFYGQSHPTSDTSTSNLEKYLSSQQALADLTYFIDEINKAYNFNSSVRWVLFGGSYAGSLAAWSRLKYPKQVFASVASSGPLQAIVNFYQYFQVAELVLNHFSPGCAGEVTKAVIGVQKMMDANNMTGLKSYFDICDGAFDPTDSGDRVYFFDQVAGNIAKEAVQYNNQLQTTSVDLVCSYMNNQSEPDPVTRLAKYYKTQSSNCIYAKNSQQVVVFKQTGWNDQFNREDLRQWRFQLCNEFGFTQTSENKTSLFSDAFPLSYYTKLCNDIFGSKYNANQLQKSVDKTNKYYGGLDIKVKRVAFVQGLLDPWYPIGLIRNPTKDSPLYTEMASHTYDTNSPQPGDPPSVLLARENVGKNLDQWLSLPPGA